MKFFKQVLFLALFYLLIFNSPAISVIPQGVNYQGAISDLDGNPLPDGPQLVKFIIYDAENGGNILWNSEFQSVQLTGGIYDIHLGSPPMTPLPWDIFANDSLRYLEITIGTDPELSPRTKITSSAYSYHSRTSDYATQAETVLRNRDLYHQIMDVIPNGELIVPVILPDASSTITVYLYGAGYQGGNAIHTHAGNNAHDHSFSGSVGMYTLSHNHGFSNTSSSSGSAHNHSGSTSSYSLAHSHSGTTASTNLSHSHSLAINSAGSHIHGFKFVGVGNTGPYLVHANDLTGLSTSPNSPAGTARLSVQSDGSHNHTGSLSSSLGTNSHSFTTSNWGNNHNHSLTTGNGSANHSHTNSGTTASSNEQHNHSVTGVVGEVGTGLENSGIASGTLPLNVNIYVDGAYAAGPFNGSFASGAIDLSSFVSTAGEHFIEIREEGGSGGRLTYNIIVE